MFLLASRLHAHRVSGTEASGEGDWRLKQRSQLSCGMDFFFFKLVAAADTTDYEPSLRKNQLGLKFQKGLVKSQDYWILRS